MVLNAVFVPCVHHGHVATMGASLRIFVVFALNFWQRSIFNGIEKVVEVVRSALQHSCLGFSSVSFRLNFRSHHCGLLLFRDFTSLIIRWIDV